MLSVVVSCDAAVFCSLPPGLLPLLSPDREKGLLDGSLLTVPAHSGAPLPPSCRVTGQRLFCWHTE